MPDNENPGPDWQVGEPVGPPPPVEYAWIGRNLWIRMEVAPDRAGLRLSLRTNLRDHPERPKD